MQIVKKYANRKLYHTNRKQYITLEGIAVLVQRGESVQVIDNESGEDITAQILAQVVLHDHDQRGPLPVTVLTGLIQAGNDTISGLRRSVGSAISGDEVDTAIERRLDELRASGQISADEFMRMRRLLVRHYTGHSTAPRSALPIVPSASDIERLSAQVDTLSAAVEQLLAEREQRG